MVIIIFLVFTVPSISELILTHSYRETHKRVIGKQCKPRSDATHSDI